MKDCLLTRKFAGINLSVKRAATSSKFKKLYGAVSGEGPEDLEELVVVQGAQMLILAGLASELERRGCRRMLE